MVEPAEADVVGPAVAADDPDARSTSSSASSSGPWRRRRAAGQRVFSRATSDARAARRPRRGRRRAARREVGADRSGSRRAAARLAPLLLGREPDTEPELGVVLEQRVGPGRPAAGRRPAPGRRREVAAVDRRAAGGVGDDQPVADELGEQLEVRRLATAGTGARELEQRLEQLGTLDRGRRECVGRPPAARRKLRDALRPLASASGGAISAAL